MRRCLLITVRLHDGRFHGRRRDGSDEWPPSPARVFQALVAAAARGSLGEDNRAALSWLEELKEEPIIAAPSYKDGQGFDNFVPNNDLDALAGNVRRIGEIRTRKAIRPRLFDASTPLLYAWTFESEDEADVQAKMVAEMADEIYQLGRGVDMAWAIGEVLEATKLDDRLESFRGAIYRPCKGGGGIALDCPERGSLQSLCVRYQANSQRFTVVGEGKHARLLFTQPPKPRFRCVPYSSPAVYLLFDMRDSVSPDAPFSSWPLDRVVALTQELRGELNADGTPMSGAAKRLWDALPDKRGEISAVMIGRNAAESDKSRRVRILPLPSIGHPHADRAIRRIIVEVPANCPLVADDVAWAFSGLEVEPGTVVDQSTGEILRRVQLVPADDASMLDHFGIQTQQGAQVWRSVTPLVLPDDPGRRRIDPARRSAEAKGGPERLSEHQRAAGALICALRHAGIRAPVTSVQVQREPFEAKGSRVEIFSPGTRFPKERLWHAEISFATPVQGPLVLGDGRYAGLGLMSPAGKIIGVHAFRIVEGLANGANPATISAALRRAVMVRAQDLLGPRETLPTFFTGHERDGAPGRGNGHRHLAFITDLVRGRLLIIAPHMMEHRNPARDEKRSLSVLAESLVGLTELRAGAAGKLELTSSSVWADDPLLATAFRWESVTEYRVTRHLKKATDRDALVADATAELARRNLPRAIRIEAIQCMSGPHGGIAGRMRIEFATAVSGPILIGRTCHSGGGLFEVAK